VKTHVENGENGRVKCRIQKRRDRKLRRAKLNGVKQSKSMAQWVPKEEDNGRKDIKRNTMQTRLGEKQKKRERTEHMKHN
jgi:hypothetical protein